VTLNCPLPHHLYVHVRREYLRNLEDGHGTWEEGCIFGVASVPNRALGFHVHLKSGGIFWRLPISALAWKPDAPTRSTPLLQAWDAFGYEIAAVAFPYLRERECTIRLKDGKTEGGVYVCTFDWYENGYSDQPDQHKCLHLVKLDDGNFAAYPNDRYIWHDLSFTDAAAKPQYRANTHIWYAEEAFKEPEPQPAREP
jgi:hypothetical protein